MSITDYNRIFGWIHNFKLGDSNIFFGKPNARPPYPPLVINPTVKQVMYNWNIADTGLFAIATVLGMIASKRHSKFNEFASVSAQKTVYWLFFNTYLAMAVYMNSYYRLVGCNPNGLHWNEQPDEELNKYDFTSEFMHKSFWKYIFQEQGKKH
jgi:hypothetical protein